MRKTRNENNKWQWLSVCQISWTNRWFALSVPAHKKKGLAPHHIPYFRYIVKLQHIASGVKEFNECSKYPLIFLFTFFMRFSWPTIQRLSFYSSSRTTTIRFLFQLAADISCILSKRICYLINKYGYAISYMSMNNKLQIEKNRKCEQRVKA